MVFVLKVRRSYPCGTVEGALLIGVPDSASNFTIVQLMYANNIGVGRCILRQSKSHSHLQLSLGFVERNSSNM